MSPVKQSLGESLNVKQDLLGCVWSPHQQKALYQLVGSYHHRASVDIDLYPVGMQSGNLNQKLYNTAHQGSLISARLSPSQTKLATTSLDGEVKIWDVQTEACLLSFTAMKSPSLGANFFQNERLLLVQTSAESLQVYHLENKAFATRFVGHEQKINSVDISRQGRFILTGSADLTVRLWDAQTGRCLQMFDQHHAAVLSVRFSHNDEFAISTDELGEIKLWDIQTGLCLRTFYGHHGRVYDAVFSHDNEVIASVGADKLVRVWNRQTGLCLNTYRGHESDVYSVCFSSDDLTLTSVAFDQLVKVWHVESGACLHTFREHQAPVVFCQTVSDQVLGQRKAGQDRQTSRNLVMSFGFDQQVKIWDVQNKTCVRSILPWRANRKHMLSRLGKSAHLSTVLSLKVAQTGRFFASSSQDGLIKFWDVQTGYCVKTFYGHQGAVSQIELSLSGQHLVSAGSDHCVRVWDADTGLCIKTLSGHTDAVLACAFHPRLSIVLSASADQTVKLWDVNSGLCMKTFVGHQAAVVSIGFSRDGQWIVTGAKDGVLKVWSLASGVCVKTMAGHDGEALHCRFIKQDGFCLSAGSDGSVKLWDIKSGRCVHGFYGHHGQVLSLDVIDEGAKFISVGQDQQLRVWDTFLGSCIKTVLLPEKIISSAAMVDQHLCLLASQDGTIKLIDPQNNKTLIHIKAFKNHTQSLAFSGQSDLLVSGTNDGLLHFWDVQTGYCFKQIEAQGGAIRRVDISNDERYVLSADQEGQVKIWQSDSGQLLSQIEPNQLVGSAVFSPDASLVACGTVDGGLQLWQTQTGFASRRLSGHTQAISKLVFSSDGKYLLSASADKTIRLWFLQTGECLDTFEGHSKAVTDICFVYGVDGFEKIVSASEDHSIRIWDISTGRCIKIMNGHRDKVTSIHVYALNHENMRENNYGLVEESVSENYLVSTGLDGWIKVWDLQTGVCLRTLGDEDLSILSSCLKPSQIQVSDSLAPPALKLACLMNNGKLVLWQIDIQHWEEQERLYLDSLCSYRLKTWAPNLGLQPLHNKEGETKLPQHQRFYVFAKHKYQSPWAVIRDESGSVQLCDPVLHEQVRYADSRFGSLHAFEFVSQCGHLVWTNNVEFPTEFWFPEHCVLE